MSSAALPPSPSISPPAGGPTVRIDGPLVVSTVEAWSRQLAAEWAGASALTLDLAAVTDLDAFGLQLLLAARRHADAAGKTLHVTNLTDRCAQVRELAGFDSAAFAVPAPRFP